MSKLLINEPPLQVLPTLAKLIGLNEAIVLQQIHYWIANPKVGRKHSGRKWIRNTVKEWQAENFPFWSVNTIKRAIDSLREKNLVLVTSDLNRAAYDKTLWYTIDYRELAELTDPTPKMGKGSENGKTQHPKWVNGDTQNGLIEEPKMGEPIPETTRESTETTKDGAKKPAPPPEKIRIPNAVRKHAEKVFRQATGLEPLPNTKANRSTNSTRWWVPLRTICEVAGGDEGLVEALIRGAVKDLTLEYVSAPQSLINTIPKIKAKLKGRSTSGADDYEKDLARRRAEARAALEANA